MASLSFQKDEIIHLYVQLKENKLSIPIFNTYFIERVGTVDIISNLFLNIKTDITRKRLPNKSSPSRYVFFMIMSLSAYIYLYLCMCCGMYSSFI